MADYYKNYLQNIAQTPKEKYLSDANAFIDAQWENTYLLCDIEEESYLGSGIYNNVEAIKRTITEYSVNVIKDESDSRTLLFKSNNHDVERGRKYKFNDNEWLVYNPTNEEEVYSEVFVRRCNNHIKWFDSELNQIFQEPCSMGEELGSPTPKINKDIIVQNGRVVLMVQGNEKTRRIKKNQRFIIDGMPYRLVAYNNYMDNSYIVDDANLLWFYCYADIEQTSDDIENNIANLYEYNYSINIINNQDKQISNYSDTLRADIMLNGEKTDKIVEWESNEFATIDNYGNYTLTGNSGDVAVFTAKFGRDIATTQVEIVSSIDNTFIKIEPMIYDIKDGGKVDIVANVYNNDTKLSDEVFVTSGDTNYCTVTSNGNNSFTLTSLKSKTELITITFTNGSIIKEIQIKLSPLY